MKIEIDIPIEEFDYESDYDEYDDGNHAKAFVNIIANKVAAQIINGYNYDTFSLKTALNNKINNIEKYLEDTITEKISKDSYKPICDKITEKISKDSYKPICDKITETVSEKIAQRYERSQQYRDIKKQFEIENDSNISTGMKALISDVVRSEVKKLIKL